MQFICVEHLTPSFGTNRFGQISPLDIDLLHSYVTQKIDAQIEGR
jgi:hypothetical protein